MALAKLLAATLSCTSRAPYSFYFDDYNLMKLGMCARPVGSGMSLFIDVNIGGTIVWKASSPSTIHMGRGHRL